MDSKGDCKDPYPIPHAPRVAQLRPVQNIPLRLPTHTKGKREKKGKKRDRGEKGEKDEKKEKRKKKQESGERMFKSQMTIFHKTAFRRAMAIFIST